MDIHNHKKQFGNQAENYTKYRRPYTDKLYAFLFHLMSEGEKKILDIACGTGKSTEPLVRGDAKVFGCDHDPLMIAEAQKQAQLKKLDIQYEVADVESLPYAGETFDVVTVGTAFHWFVNEKSISEIKRVLKPGGIFFVFWTLTVKNTPEENSIPWEFLQSFNWERVPQELRNLEYISNFLTQQGMKNVHTEKIPFAHNDNVDDQVGLMTTASNFSLLSESDQQRFVHELTDIMTKKLGSREFFTLEEEIQICFGYK
jgi:ubiquinone/menaquinone biosynthesis C-methylase UbiE